jgi:hypothetical protein
MKREILFKAKRSDGKGWVCGYVLGIEYEEEIHAGIIEEFEHNPTTGFSINSIIEVIPETVCQYTGLKDKNGEKVFRFDATKCGCVVDLCEHRCGWALKVYDFKEEVYCNCLECEGNFDIFDDKIEIIGNIHDK